MKGLIITNIKDKDKTPLDYYNNSNYKKFGISSSTTKLLPMYQELLREVIGNDVNTTFIDRVLTEEETRTIQSIFSQKIDENISQVEISDEKLPHRKLEWKNKVYDLNLSLTSPMNRRIWDFYTIVEICKECLEENKPMYLSIE